LCSPDAAVSSVLTYVVDVTAVLPSTFSGTN
jgi:hypothetical protein